LNEADKEVNIYLQRIYAFLFAAFVIYLWRRFSTCLSVPLAYLGEKCCCFMTESWKALWRAIPTQPGLLIPSWKISNWLLCSLTRKGQWYQLLRNGVQKM